MVRYVKDMHWLIELERAVAIEDLENQYYQDPNSKEMLPVFYLDDLKKAIKDKAVTLGEVTGFFGGVDYGKDLRKHLFKNKDDNNEHLTDIPRAHLAHVWEKKRYSCFALIGSEAFPISYKEFPFHKPRIPYRIKVYTQNNHSAYGKSALKPIEHCLYMLNDIQKYGMSAFFRFVNELVAIKQEGIVSVDDFKRRSGGKVRIKGDGPISDYIMGIPTRDNTSTMFAQQSNIRGFT